MRLGRKPRAPPNVSQSWAGGSGPGVGGLFPSIAARGEPGLEGPRERVERFQRAFDALFERLFASNTTNSAAKARA